MRDVGEEIARCSDLGHLDGDMARAPSFAPEGRGWRDLAFLAPAQA
jgi:hypothetical protein